MMRRSRRLGVGKEIGGAIYIHRSYGRLIGADLRAAKRRLPKGLQFDVLKWRPAVRAVSFISCPTFDAEPEPAVGDVFFVPAEGKCRLFRASPSNPWVYHHKWLFVADDYKGFDVEESRQRSSMIARASIDRSRIGRRIQWDAVRRTLGLD